jgi:hypothetical protein
MCGQASCPYRERPAPGRFVWVDIAITLRSADSGRLGGVARYISLRSVCFAISCNGVEAFCPPAGRAQAQK